MHVYIVTRRLVNDISGHIDNDIRNVSTLTQANFATPKRIFLVRRCCITLPNFRVWD